MPMPVILMLLILGASLVFFMFEWIPADVVALGVLLALLLTRLLPADEAFAGFGSDTVLMILGLLIMTAALMRTGVVDMAGRLILKHAGTEPSRLLTIVTVGNATLGSVMSNTASTAFFLPTVLGLSQRARISPSKLLMPLAFASIITSSVTLISTSTNIVVDGLLKKAGMAPMGMFELAPVGIPIAIVGLAYILTIGKRLIPERAPVADPSNDFGMRPYLTEVLVLPGSPLAGQTLAGSGLARDMDLTVLRIVRGKDQTMAPRPSTRLEEGDVILVEGGTDDILKIKDKAGVDIKADVKLSDPELQTEDVKLAEVVVMPRSPLLGRTLKESRFRERFDCQVLAVNRAGDVVRRKISEIRLSMGDVLLLQGHKDRLTELAQDDTFRIIGAVETQRPNLKHAPLAMAIFVGVLALGTFKVLPLAVAMLLGAFLVLATRCLTPEEAYREVEWKAIILIGCMLALGAAMSHSGTAQWLADHIVAAAGGAHPAWLLAGFFVLTVVLTQPMSNQAAAVVVFPVAIHTALQLGLNPRTFAMMIAVAASCSYMTPLEPSCLMVYGPGKYRFSDFLKVGTPLTVLIFLVAMLLVPLVWPLRLPTTG